MNYHTQFRTVNKIAATTDAETAVTAASIGTQVHVMPHFPPQFQGDAQV